MKKCTDSRGDIQADATQEGERTRVGREGERGIFLSHFSHFSIQSHYFPSSPVSGVRLDPAQQLQPNLGKQ